MKKSRQTTLEISVRDQTLTLKGAGNGARTFPISTSRFGLGTKEGSMKTPLGRFRIAAKIGAGMPAKTVFKNRRPLRGADTSVAAGDLVMARILWLDGLGARNANTHDRYIYIHGTNHERKIGIPASHGCIRMKNADMVELFDLVQRDTPVLITARKPRRRAPQKSRKSLRRIP